MAKLGKSGIFLKTQKENEIKGASVKHLDKSNTTKSFFHLDTTPAIIVKPFVDAAINLANGNVSIGEIEDGTYFEILTEEGTLCSIIQKDEIIKYEFDEELDDVKNLWILAVVILYNALREKGNKELKDVFASMKREIKKHSLIANDDAFILCDYLTYRLVSKNKSNIDIDMDKVEKVRRITLNSAGDIYELVEDLTPAITGKDGVFERISIPMLTSSTTKANETFLGKGNYLFEDDLTEEEKGAIPKLTGVVERFEYIDAIETIYDARNREHPKNIVFATGATGSGKSFFAKVLASELGLPYWTMSGDEDGGTNIFKGNWVIEDGNMIYKPSFFAQKISRPCVFELAESSSFLASKLTQIYPLLDKDCMSLMNEDNVLLRRHPHCIIVFTCNTYACLNDVAPSIPGRSATILRLPMMDRDNLRKVILRENDNEPIDSDIMENVLDCVERIEDFLKSSSAPRGCESSIRGYAAWADKIQNSRKHNRYDPIYAAKTTILPIISAGINFDENLEKTLIDTIITPVFNFVENGGE